MISQQTLKGNLLLQDYTTAFTLNQGDKGVPFKVELLENGAPYILQSTDIVTIEWLNPNGNPFLQEGDIKYGTNYIEFTTPESVAQYSGSGSFNIIISNSDVRKGTIRREYKVVPTSMRPGSISEDVITDAMTELRNLNSTLTSTIQTGNLDNYAKKTYVNKEVELINSSLEEKAKQSYVDSKVDEINSSIEEIATKGTTVDVIEQATKEEIERQIEDGTIANLTIEDYSIDYKKDKFLSGNIATSNKNFLEINFKTGKITVNTLVLVTIKDVKWQLDACEVDLDKYANNTWIIVYKTPNNTADADSRVLLDCDINSMPNGAVILFKILKDTRGYYHLVENTSITNGTLIDNDGTKRILSILQINDFVEDAIKTDFKNANILTKNQTALVENKAISDLRFRLKAIKNNRNMELLNFEEKFESEDCIFDLFDRVNGGYLSAEEDISANIVVHRFVFKNL